MARAQPAAQLLLGRRSSLLANTQLEMAKEVPKADKASKKVKVAPVPVPKSESSDSDSSSSDSDSDDAASTAKAADKGKGKADPPARPSSSVLFVCAACASR